MSNLLVCSQHHNTALLSLSKKERRKKILQQIPNNKLISWRKAEGINILVRMGTVLLPFSISTVSSTAKAQQHYRKNERSTLCQLLYSILPTASRMVQHKEFITPCSEASIKNIEEYNSNGRHAGAKATRVVAKKTIQDKLKKYFVQEPSNMLVMPFFTCFPVFA